MSKTFFSQQNDTKIKDFDLGVLILEQFFCDFWDRSANPENDIAWEKRP